MNSPANPQPRCLACDAPIRELEWPKLCQRCAMAYVLESSSDDTARHEPKHGAIREWALARRAAAARKSVRP